MTKFTPNFLRFLIFAILQVFVFNYVQWFGFLNPFVFLIFLLLLPLETPLWLQYAIAFATGLVIDSFLRTFGIQALACTIMVFVRPYLILLLNGFKPLETGVTPKPGVKDFNWILVYTFILVFVHQLTVTILETFQWAQWWRIIWTSVINAIFTTFVLLCFEYIFYRNKK